MIGDRSAHPNMINQRSISVGVGGFLLDVFGWGNGFWINPPLRFYIWGLIDEPNVVDRRSITYGLGLSNND
jgi:hypothetical protein